MVRMSLTVFLLLLGLASLAITVFLGTRQWSWQWRLLGVVLMPLLAWFWYFIRLKTMSPSCREDDECSLNAALVAFAAIAVTVGCVTGGLASVGWDRLHKPRTR